jgi:hypothetical protein
VENVASPVHRGIEQIGELSCVIRVSESALGGAGGTSHGETADEYGPVRPEASARQRRRSGDDKAAQEMTGFVPS